MPTHRRVHTDTTDFTSYLRRQNEKEFENVSLFSGFKSPRMKALDFHENLRQRRLKELEESEEIQRQRREIELEEKAD